MALTNKQRRFVDEYLVDLNATQAAIRAGYSSNRADAMGHENLRKPEIAAALNDAMEARQKRTHITQDRVLQELARIAFFDIRKLYNDDGSMKKPSELDDDAAAVLAGVDVVEMSASDGAPLTFTKKAKVFDKGSALTLAMRHLGMLTDKVEQTITTRELPASVDEFV